MQIMIMETIFPKSPPLSGEEPQGETKRYTSFQMSKIFGECREVTRCMPVY